MTQTRNMLFYIHRSIGRRHSLYWVKVLEVTAKL